MQSPLTSAWCATTPFLAYLAPSPEERLGQRAMKKGLRGRNSPMCTLSQNGYGDKCCRHFRPSCPTKAPEGGKEKGEGGSRRGSGKMGKPKPYRVNPKPYELNPKLYKLNPKP